MRTAQFSASMPTRSPYRTHITIFPYETRIELTWVSSIAHAWNAGLVEKGLLAIAFAREGFDT